MRRKIQSKILFLNLVPWTAIALNIYFRLKDDIEHLENHSADSQIVNAEKSIERMNYLTL